MVHIVVTMRANRLDIVRLHTILLLLGSTEVVRSSPQPTTVRSLLGRRFSLVYSALFLRLVVRCRMLGDSGRLFVDIVRPAAHLQPLMSFVRVRPYPTAGGLFLHCGKHLHTHPRCRAVCASLAWYTHSRCLQRVPCTRLPGCLNTSKDSCVNNHTGIVPGGGFILPPGCVVGCSLFLTRPLR